MVWHTGTSKEDINARTVKQSVTVRSQRFYQVTCLQTCI